MVQPKQVSAERESIRKRINQMMDESYGCAESLVTAVGEHLWGDVDDGLKMISTGFSGGVGGTHEELCGGVSGAAILLSRIYGRTTNDEAKMVRCKRLISEHRDLFIQEFETTICQKLRDAEYGADEENPCSALIVPAAFMLLDVIEAETEREKAAAASNEKVEESAFLPLEEFKNSNSAKSPTDLINFLDEIDLPHTHREWIGDQLEELGDPRPGVGLLNDLIPEINYQPFPSGSVVVERAGEFQVQEGLIAKYPVTYQQFQPFLDDPDGFLNSDWWTGLDREAQTDQPGDQRFPVGNYPRDNVSWYDAVAYCRWLTEKIRNLDGEIDFPGKTLIQKEGWEIRLPTEWEWQMSATAGKEERKYPWGTDWDDRLAHTKHNQLNKSMAVGMYPAGISPIGAFDMSGNVWEWCLNCYEVPEDLAIGRTDRRVLRGGSWYHWGSYAHTDMRSRYFPDHRYNAGGFRVICAKPL